MDKKVDLLKKVWDKTQYENTIDTQFIELGVKDISEEIQSQFTVDDFFIKYDELFYEIPERGSINSHEYIIKTSSEYIKFEENLETINALQQEIAQLRQELLDEQIKNIKSTSNG